MNFARRSVLTLLIVIAFAIAASAQAPPPYLNISRVTVKPDRLGEWLDIQKQYMEAYKKGGGLWMTVWRNSIGNPYEFLVITPLDNYSQRDGQSPTQKGMAEGDLARLSARRNQATESVRTTIEKPVAELTYVKEGAAPPKMLRVNHTRVRPGMADQYIALMKELVTAYKKVGVPAFRVRRIEFGGSRQDFHTGMPMEKWAELDGQSIAIKALGEAGFKTWSEKIYQTISFSEYMIYSFVPDASFVPQQ
jgi:hypothetical protein